MNLNLFSKYIKRKNSNTSIFLRKNSVDLEVYDYVFKEQYHRPYLEIKSEAPIILDLGCNIGLTVVDFKSVYPKSHIYAYEMDKENYLLALKNCLSLSDCNINNLAIWFESISIQYNKKVNVDAYAITLNESNSEALGSADTITLGQIIEQNELNRIDYVKMDIEGAEKEIFMNNLDWLGIVREIKIEVHYGADVMDYIWKRLEGKGFMVIKDTKHWSTIIGYKL